MSKVTHIMCDICETEINTNENYIDASVYGAHFHIECADATGIQILKSLYLDDITIRRNGGDYQKLIYSDWLKLHTK